VSSLDRARDLVRDAGGAELLERLDHLDAARGRGRRAEAERLPAPDAGRTDFDVIVAGGGLWSLVAPLLAARGLRVAVFDRARAAQAHREWNASGPELEALVRAGLLDPGELEALIVARYDVGFCRFHGGGTYPVVGVLDRAVDAGGLLAHGRALAEGRGVTVVDDHAVVAHASGRSSVRVRVRSGQVTRDLSAKVLVDARGAASPYASADLVCPTVGGVLRGLAEGTERDAVDPRVGEILVTTEGVEEGRQYIWEGFPGRPGETTVYLFHYARAEEPLSLAALYARFFERLGTYKRGDARLVRPTFGFIPGWSRLSPAPRAPDGRVVLVGDAAARHSPLTYCGFGATLRSLSRAADAIARAANGEPVDLSCVVDDTPAHAFTGALATVVASGACRGDEANRLLDAAFRSLTEMGDGPYARLLRDELAPGEFVRFLRKTAGRHPAAWRHVMRALGPLGAGRWAAGVAWSSLARRTPHRETA
jgi:lycopene cyclase CruA